MAAAQPPGAAPPTLGSGDRPVFPGMGWVVGAAVGAADGTAVGLVVGVVVGTDVGAAVGVSEQELT